MSSILKIVSITFLLIFLGCRKKSEQPILSIGEDKIPMRFEPFSHISTLKPAESTVNAAIELLGKPISQEFYKNDKGDTTKVWSEFECGISIIIEGLYRDTTKIDAIVAQKDYKGKSVTGLALGFPRDKAMNLLKQKYMVTELSSETVIFKLNESSSCTQLFFENDKVSAIKMYR